MDPTVFYLAGGLFILIGFLNQIRLRITRARYRLRPAATIRGARPNQGLSPVGESSSVSAINVLLMLTGAGMVIAGIVAP